MQFFELTISKNIDEIIPICKLGISYKGLLFFRQEILNFRKFDKLFDVNKYSKSKRDSVYGTKRPGVFCLGSFKTLFFKGKSLIDNVETPFYFKINLFFFCFT